MIKAVMTDIGGTFSTHAYRLIWNEICDELIRNTKLVLNEEPADMIEIFKQVQDPPETHDLRHTLQQAKEQAHGGAARGIECLELMVQ